MSTQASPRVTTPVRDPERPGPERWWRDAVVYQVYPRSWAASTTRGTGDLRGITARLPYLRDLGVDALWLSPFYPSPQEDSGYDVALPGSAYLYQGDELGLPEATDLPDAVRRDPTFARSGGAVVGRDGCRVPFPWVGDAPGFGFGPGGATWLPQPPEFGALAVDRQEGVPGSTLELVRSALTERRSRGLGSGGLRVVEGYPPTVVALLVTTGDGADVLVVANAGTEPVAIPPGATPLLSSDGVAPGPQGAVVAPDTTVWAAWDTDSPRA